MLVSLTFVVYIVLQFFSTPLASLQFAINPITAAFIYTCDVKRIADTTLLAIIWSSADGGKYLPLAALACASWTMPLHAIVLAPPVLRLVWMNFSSNRLLSHRTGVHVTGFPRVVVTTLAWLCIAQAVYFAWGTSWAGFNPYILRGGGPRYAAELQPTWYIRSLAFTRFSPYFDTLMSLHPFIFIAPLTIRFW
jgi:hypothetical protein